LHYKWVQGIEPSPEQFDRARVLGLRQEHCIFQIVRYLGSRYFPGILVVVRAPVQEFAAELAPRDSPILVDLAEKRRSIVNGAAGKGRKKIEIFLRSLSEPYERHGDPLLVSFRFPFFKGDLQGPDDPVICRLALQLEQNVGYVEGGVCQLSEKFIELALGSRAVGIHQGGEGEENQKGQAAHSLIEVYRSSESERVAVRGGHMGNGVSIRGDLSTNLPRQS
jgi:hypothetical protein